MNLELDPVWLRTSMKLWRNAVDMKIPLHDQVKIHMLGQRPSLLAGFAKTAGDWLIVLNACTAEGSDLAELDSLKADVQAFKEWAADGCAELRSMGMNEARADRLGEMLSARGRRPPLYPPPKSGDR